MQRCRKPQRNGWQGQPSLLSHLAYSIQTFIDISYNLMAPTALKAFLDSGRIDLLAAMIYSFADKESFRLALDQLILTFAYDDPFDEDILMLDGIVASKFTNTMISAITDTEGFQPVPDLPIITAYHEYVFI